MAMYHVPRPSHGCALSSSLQRVSVKVSREKWGKRCLCQGLKSTIPYCLYKAQSPSLQHVQYGLRRCPRLVYQRMTFYTQPSSFCKEGQTLPDRSAARAAISQKFFFHHEHQVRHMRLAWSLRFGYEVARKRPKCLKPGSVLVVLSRGLLEHEDCYFINRLNQELRDE